MVKQKVQKDDPTEKFIRTIKPEAAIVSIIKDGRLLVNMEGNKFGCLKLACEIVKQLIQEVGPMAKIVIMSEAIVPQVEDKKPKHN